jgi:hypothetical protein
MKQGDRISVTGDSILTDIMGLGDVVTGTVFTVNPDGKVLGFKCDATGCIECLDDGLVKKI